MKRRQFLGLSLGFGSITLAADRAPMKRLDRRKAAATLGTARNVIFVLLDGGPSHVDTFDLKLFPETPDSLGARNMGGWQWPAGIMPQLADRASQFSLVRSISAVEAVHERAVYHLLTAHRQNAALQKEIPHFASVLAYHLEAQRAVGDTLPTVMKIGFDPAANGFLDKSYLGLNLGEDGSVAA